MTKVLIVLGAISWVCVGLWILFKDLLRPLFAFVSLVRLNMKWKRQR